MTHGRIAVTLLFCSTLASGPGCDPGADRDRPRSDSGTPPTAEEQIGTCCQTPQECVSGHCTRFPLLSKDRVCSTPCVTNSDCPSRTACQRVSIGPAFHNVCLPCELVANTNPRVCGAGPGGFRCLP